MNPQQGVYLVKESLRTAQRHRGLSAISIVIMSLSLLILAVFLLVTDNVLKFMSEAREEMEIHVYLKDPLQQSMVEDYHRRLLSMPEVERMVFVSKEEALLEFRREMGEDGGLLDELEANPLPASFRIAPKNGLKNKEDIERFAAQVGAMEGVEEVRYGKEFLEKFSAVARGFLYVDAFIGFIVILSSAFIISNVVRLSVVSRRKNVEILKLVGATNRFIATPFIIEGALQTGIASLVSIGLLFIVYLVSMRIVPELSYFSAQKTLAYIGTCILIGAVGSFGALRRFLKV